MAEHGDIISVSFPFQGLFAGVNVAGEKINTKYRATDMRKRECQISEVIFFVCLVVCMYMYLD